ncbi:MAG TPA: copper transporter [Jiangellales bacterium]|nr:copper transporter [Jiangellales bacterium]
MIDFRYHLVSIIAIFFALAAGIALGAGPLKAGVDQTLTDQTSALREENQQLRDQIATLEGAADYRDAFVGAVTSELIEGRLADRRVVLVAMPGADADQVAAISDTLTGAGATVGATVSIDATWTDAGSAPVLDTLASELVTSGTTLPEGDGYDRGAAVLAGALLDPAEDLDPAEEAVGEEDSGVEPGTEPTEEPAPGTDGGAGSSATVLAAFAEAGLVGVEGEPAPEADLAVAIAGPPFDDDELERRNAAMVTLATALDAAGSGAVVAGPPSSAGETGVIAAVRADGNAAGLVSTVDVATLPSGRVAVVYALEEQADGGSGHYGAIGTTDGPLPTGDQEQ